jgi:hypothetical protein
MSPASYQTAPPRDVSFRFLRPSPILTKPGHASHLRAGNGTRTRDPNLGKVVLYQLSYSREAVRILAPDPPRRNDPETGHARLKGAVEARGIEPLTS